MFARRRLRPGSPEYDAYYAMRPENRESDERTRALPGLLSPDATKADPIAFAAAAASDAVCAVLRNEVDGAVAEQRNEASESESTALVKRLAHRFGARGVGVTRLRPYHVYTHVGRGSGTWGEPIALNHRWAIAFTVEMDHAAMRCAPEGPVVAESCRQYVEAAKIAVQLAGFIRARGYPARAHVDGNYRVIAPLVAWDAGLGEIGRMGILMTPELGPRVRLGVVTTEMPLVADPPGDDVSVIDFCTACKKCAENCPSESISFGERETNRRNLPLGDRSRRLLPLLERDRHGLWPLHDGLSVLPSRHGLARPRALGHQAFGRGTASRAVGGRPLLRSPAPCFG